MVQTFKCRTTPADVGSPTYEVTVQYFSNGNAENWIQFQKCLDRVFNGQGDTNVPNKYAKIRQLLQGEALAALETHVVSISGHTETNDWYRVAVNSVSKHVFPRNAAKLQKRLLRCYLRKPEDTNTMLELLPFCGWNFVVAKR